MSPHAAASERPSVTLTQSVRHAVKPGNTGWARVDRWRCETDNLCKMEKCVE